jgi:hypothetical protein
MSNVIVKLVTKTQKFPVGTTDVDFVFTISNAGGVVDVGVSPASEFTFVGVAPGDYTAKVEKFGVFAEVSFTISEVPPEEVDISVPNSITVEISAP